MSYNGSGTFVINSTGQPVVTGTVISSSTFNSLTADLGTGLSTAITKDGQTTTTAKIPFAQGLSAAVASNFAAGTVGAPSIYLSTDTTTGLYRIGANNDGFAISGVKLLDLGSALVGITGALTVSTTLNVTGVATLGNGAVLGTPASGTVTNLTGTASININGTVGATTATTGAFTSGTFSTTLGVTGVATFTAAGGIVLNRTNANTALIWQNNTVEKLRITNRGDASDAIQFSVANATLDALTFTQAGAVTIPGNTTFGASGVNVVTKIFSEDAASLNLSVNSSNAANRNFGIGTSYAAYGQMDIRVGASLGSDPFSGGVLIMGLTATGVTIPGTLGVTGASLTLGGDTVAAPILSINGTAGSSKQIKWFSAGVEKWNTYMEATTHTLQWASVAVGPFVLGLNQATGIVTMGVYGAGAATFSAAGVISSVSDETWKIKDGIPTNPDAMLNKLAPGYWYYNNEKKETFGKDRQLGFYAQNVNAAIGPEAAPEPETFTTKNEDGTETTTTKPWGYYDRSVLAITVMSLQKALTRLAALEAK